MKQFNKWVSTQKEQCINDDCGMGFIIAKNAWKAALKWRLERALMLEQNGALMLHELEADIEQELKNE